MTHMTVGGSRGLVPCETRLRAFVPRLLLLHRAQEVASVCSVFLKLHLHIHIDLILVQGLQLQLVFEGRGCCKAQYCC